MKVRLDLRKCVRICVAGCLLLGLASAQTRQFEGKRIAAITYEPSADLLAPEDLARVQPLKVGSELHASEIAHVIDQLYATGRFEDVQVDAELNPAGEVNLRFITQPAWFVGQIQVTGKTSSPPNRGQLANAAQLTAGMPYHDSDMKTALENLKRQLESNGLYEATIKPEIQRDPKTQTMSFTFTINAGKRAKYTQPVFNQGTNERANSAATPPTAATPPPAPLSDTAILRATGWRIPVIHWWRQVSQQRTNSGVDGILKKYQKQDRLTAKVRIDSLDYLADKRRVKPTLTITPGPKVRVRAVEAKISKSRLKRYVPVYEEGTADRDLIVEGARNLRDYFQSEGYYDVGVDFRPVRQSPDEVTVEYVIALGTRYKLVHIEMQGNKYFDVGTLRDRMFLQTSSLQYRHGRYSQAFLKKDEEAIANLYKANGFRDCRVKAEIQNPYKKAGQIGVSFQIEEGAQWFVDDLKLVGATQVPADSLLAKLSSVKGQPYTDVNVATDRNTILSQYYSSGFPEATFAYQVVPIEDSNRVMLTYLITEGRPQFVRDVLLSGIRSTRRNLVNKRISVHAGDPLSPTAVTNTQKALYDLGVFAKVDAAVQDPDGDEDHRYVLYNFEEAQRYTVKVGFGAEIAQFGGTTTNLNSPGGATGFSPRGSLDVSRLNVFGLGQTASFRARVSDLEQRAAISYLIPRFLDGDAQSLTFTILYDKARDVRTFSSTRQEASVQFSRQVSRATKVLLSYSYRRVSTSNIVIPALLVPQLLLPVRIGSLSATVARDRRDDPTDAHKGSYNTIDASLAANFFGSQRNFARILGRNATYYKIGKKAVFARQTQFGMILPYNPPAGIDSADSVPLPERFFGGGANSHRGFPFNQAGPRDIGVAAASGGLSTQPTGFPLGGNALFFNTFEYRFPLIGDNIGGVLFHDAGNVYRSVGDISFRSSQKDTQDFNYMVHAAGFGIRYKTPIGPVRLDLAYSINPPSFIGFKGTQAELLNCNPNVAPTGVCVGVKQNVSHFQFSFSIGQAF